MAGHNKWKDIKREPAKKHFDVGSKVFINVYHPDNPKAIHICEARIIRQPHHNAAPYKLMVTAVKVVGDKEPTPRTKKLLGLKLLRKQESVFSGKVSHWTRQETDRWVRLEDTLADKLVHKAVKNIRRELARRTKR